MAGRLGWVWPPGPAGRVTERQGARARPPGTTLRCGFGQTDPLEAGRLAGLAVIRWLRLPVSFDKIRRGFCLLRNLS